MDNIFWFGIVENIIDPEKLGRVQCRIFGVHDSNKITLPTEDLPWALVNKSTDNASVSGIGETPHGIVNGSLCLIIFTDPISKQQPIVLGTILGIPNEIIENNIYLNNNRKYKSENDKGFVDPDKVYPKYFNESDVNRLARNENIEQTIVKDKKDNIIKNINIANNEQTWSEPETQYNAQYPYNHVLETTSGHVFEYDDTPNNERIHQYHKSGSFYEIYPDGQKVEKIVKDNYQLILNDDYIYIKGNTNVYIGNNANIYVKGNCINEIKGNCENYIEKDCENQILGDCNTYIEGDYNLGVKGNINFTSGGTTEMVSDGFDVQSSQDIKLKGTYIKFNE